MTSAETDPLFRTLRFGAVELRNRVFMAPMTRGRATQDGVPTPIMARYYAERAGAGAIITEATSISVQGRGWVNAPGIYTDAHQEHWQPVTTAVHDAGSRIFLQLWHMGRVSHPDFQEGGALPVAPSAIAAKGVSHGPQGKKPYVEPRPLDASELPGLVADYVAAAERAIAAGFDGVELHGANGYLLDQFIRDGTNQRTDAFGGTIENRWRFPLQVVRAVADAVGPEHTGIRLSPTSSYSSMSDSDPVSSYAYGAARLEEAQIAFVHLVEPLPGHFMGTRGAPAVAPTVRAAFSRALILNGGYGADTARAALEAGEADAIAFGIPFLANPDLPERYRRGVTELNRPDMATLYTPGEEGYTDYPTFEGPADRQES